MKQPSRLMIGLRTALTTPKISATANSVATFFAVLSPPTVIPLITRVDSHSARAVAQRRKTKPMRAIVARSRQRRYCSFAARLPAAALPAGPVASGRQALLLDGGTRDHRPAHHSRWRLRPPGPGRCAGDHRDHVVAHLAEPGHRFA